MNNATSPTCVGFGNLGAQAKLNTSFGNVNTKDFLLALI